MNLDRLQNLKQKLVQAQDFSDVWEFYMDEFTDHVEFIEVGRPVSHPFLEAVIPKICQQLFGQDVTIANLLIISIPEHQFYHAPFQADRRIGGVFYFEDINVGLLAISAQFPPTDEVKYSRFSVPFQQLQPNPHDRN
jgi:hypothetical protein